MGGKLTIDIDVEPREFNLATVSVFVSPEVRLVGTESLLNKKKGDKIEFALQKNVLYDVFLISPTEEPLYSKKGVKYDSVLKLTEIIKSKLPSSY